MWKKRKRGSYNPWEEEEDPEEFDRQDREMELRELWEKDAKYHDDFYFNKYNIAEYKDVEETSLDYLIATQQLEAGLMKNNKHLEKEKEEQKAKEKKMV